MAELVNHVLSLQTKYKNNKKVLEKLSFFIKKQLPALLEKYNEDEKKRELLKDESKKYINEFIMNPDKQYFYIPATDLFIKYNGEIYECMSEDEFWYIVLNDITNRDGEGPKLIEYKQRIKNTIVEYIKKRSIFKTIPESYTVQLVINFFTPTLFNTKEDVKHFLACIGDNILNKKTDNIYFVPIRSKSFFDALESLCEYYFQTKLNITSSLRYRYRGQDFKKSRLIYFTRSIRNKSCWLSFLKENFLNFIIVCCHYSTRYIHADNYANKQAINFKEKLFYLKNHTKENIINEFINNIFEKCSNNNIKWEDIYFLWKFYIKNKNIPNMIYKADFENIIRNNLDHNGNIFINIKSNHLNNVEYFKKFCNDNITTDEDDILEISEMHKLVIKWLNDKEYCDFTEDYMKDMIEYFYNDITIENDKFLIGVKCKLWDKQGDILEAVQQKFNKNITDNVIIYDAYVMYCKYSNNNGKLLTVSKKYFYKYIDRIIPTQYIQDNSILFSYWSEN